MLLSSYSIEGYGHKAKEKGISDIHWQNIEEHCSKTCLLALRVIAFSNLANCLWITEPWSKALRATTAFTWISGRQAVNWSRVTVKTRSFLQYWGVLEQCSSSSISAAARQAPNSSRSIFHFFHPKGADLCSVVCSSSKEGSRNTFQACWACC